ncbi:hypothetical protein EMIT091MI3_280032 [Kosakonia quasisacchari]
MKSNMLGICMSAPGTQQSVQRMAYLLKTKNRSQDIPMTPSTDDVKKQ